MGDLYFDDIEDKAYTDKMILEDVRALVRAGQREGTLLDYKTDVSDKDTWPPSVAAFANSFGGLIIFGVEGKSDQPRRLTGFDPKGIEIKTKLTSMVIDRIQPRPDFSVRVVTYDQDPTREVALLRVAEGRNPPYMHSTRDEHRVYIRVGAQKMEADYLQLSSLLEKRARNTSQRVATANEMFGSDALLHVPQPTSPKEPSETQESYELRTLRGTNLISSEFFRFVLSPRNIGPDLRLDFATERLFCQCVRDLLSAPDEPLAIRSKHATVFRMSSQSYGEQRFGLATKGGTGFVSYPGIKTNTGVYFVPMDFCRSLLDFLSISALFYEKLIRFYGSCVLEVNMLTGGVVRLFDGFPTRNDYRKGSDLFHPPLRAMNVNDGSQIELEMSPMLPDRLQDYLEAILVDLVRPSGSVLSPRFREGMKELADDAVRRLNSARSA